MSINAYYLWQANFVNSSPAIQFCSDSVTSPQTWPGGTGTSNMSTSYYSFSFNTLSDIPEGYNMIILFTGYSNVTTVLNNLTVSYPSSVTSMITAAQTYFTGTSGDIALCIGGSDSVYASWNTGYSGAIAQLYQAFTLPGTTYTYTETGTGNTLSIIGNTGDNFISGTYTGIFSAFVFDIETWSVINGASGSSGTDFLNLFAYIKSQTSSTIIVTISHSCSNFNGTGQTVISTILSDTTSSYDYISPQLYTQNTGVLNEYAANANIPWTGSDSFVSYLEQNTVYSTKNVGMILPSIFSPTLYTNESSVSVTTSPNLYYYQSTPNNENPVVNTYDAVSEISYSGDGGATNFFQTIFNSQYSLGGYGAFINGTMNVVETASPTTVGSTGGQFFYVADGIYNACYYGGQGSSNSSTNGGSPGNFFSNTLYVPYGSAYSTIVIQVYGAGGGGGGGETTNGGIGGGGGAGAYCCFSLNPSDIINGEITLYIPGGGGGGGYSEYSGGVGGGGGMAGDNGSGGITSTNNMSDAYGNYYTNYFQIPTSISWSSNTYSGATITAAASPSGCGGAGYYERRDWKEIGTEIEANALTIEVLLGMAEVGDTTNSSRFAILLELMTSAVELAGGYQQQDIQGRNPTITPPALVNIGIPYSSPSYNNNIALQTGSRSSSTCNPNAYATTSGATVNCRSYGNSPNNFLFGNGGTGGLETTSGGYGGAVYITLF